MHPRPAGDGAGPWALQAVTLGAELRERGIGLHVIEQDTDTDTMEGPAMSGMTGGLQAALSPISGHSGPTRPDQFSCPPGGASPGLRADLTIGRHP